MMHAIINDEPIPEHTIRYVSLSLGGHVMAQGEAIKEQDRLDLMTILGGIKEEDVVEFDFENKDYENLNGAGTIKMMKIDEESLSDKMIRIKYNIAVQLIK